MPNNGRRLIEPMVEESNAKVLEEQVEEEH